LITFCAVMRPWVVLFSLHLLAHVQGLEVLRIPNLQGSSDPNKAVANANTSTFISRCPAAQAVPQRAGIDDIAWDNQGCFQSDGFDSKMDLAHSCLTSLTVGLKKSRAIYLIGDSHAAHLLHAFQKASNLPVFWMSWANTAHFQNPMQKLEPELKQVLSKDDIVVFNMFLQSAEEAQFYHKQLGALHHVTSAVGAKIVLIGDTPMWPKPIQECLLKVTPGQESPCATSQELLMSNQLARRINMAWEPMPDIFFFDALEHYCKQGRCDIFIPGTSTTGFHDFFHMGSDGSRYLAPFVCDFLHRNGLVTL